MSEQNDSPVLIMFTRLEAKLDVALAQHGAKLDQHGSDIADHETRIRGVEARPIAPTDHETRLRTVESRPVITWRALMTAIGVCAAAIAALTPFVAKLYGG